MDRVAGQQAARLRAVTLELQTSLSRPVAAAQVAKTTPGTCRLQPDVRRRPPLAYAPRTPHGRAPKAVTFQAVKNDCEIREYSESVSQK